MIFTPYLAWFNNIEGMLVVLAIILILFGGKKIPELMRGLGRGVGEMKRGLEEGKRHFEDTIHEEPKQEYKAPEGETQPRQTSTPEEPVKK